MRRIKLKIFIILFLFCSLITYAQRLAALTIDSNGYKLSAFYHSLDVEHLWIKGHHVNWETGEPDRDDDVNNKITHCSRLVAAGCKRVNIYIARPPDIKPHLMANAQFDWLATNDAKEDGWEPVVSDDIINEWDLAQQYADEGYVTVAVCKNPDPHKSGHIAFVTPANITDEQIKDSGPMLTQAGHFNANATSMKHGFENHITTWPEKSILFYYNKNRPAYNAAKNK